MSSPKALHILPRLVLDPNMTQPQHIFSSALARSLSTTETAPITHRDPTDTNRLACLGLAGEQTAKYTARKLRSHILVSQDTASDSQAPTEPQTRLLKPWRGAWSHGHCVVQPKW